MLRWLLLSTHSRCNSSVASTVHSLTLQFFGGFYCPLTHAAILRWLLLSTHSRCNSSVASTVHSLTLQFFGGFYCPLTHAAILRWLLLSTHSRCNSSVASTVHSLTLQFFGGFYCPLTHAAILRWLLLPTHSRCNSSVASTAHSLMLQCFRSMLFIKRFKLQELIQFHDLHFSMLVSRLLKSNHGIQSQKLPLVIARLLLDWLQSISIKRGHTRYFLYSLLYCTSEWAFSRTHCLRLVMTNWFSTNHEKKRNSLERSDSSPPNRR